LEKGNAPATATSKQNAGRFCPSLLGDFAPKLSTLRTLLWSGGAEGGVGNVNWSTAVVSWGLKYIKAAVFKREETNKTLNDIGSMSARLTEFILKSGVALPKVSPNVWIYNNETSLKSGLEIISRGKDVEFSVL